MNITMTTKMVLRHDTKAGDLCDFFASLPRDARISINKSKYYDQRDPGETSITAVWTEDRTPKPDVGVTAWRDR